MSRVRIVAAASCLAITLLAARPVTALAQRSAKEDAAIARSEPVASWLLASAIAWGEEATTWMQAIFAAAHGTIIPIVPPDLPPPSPEDPSSPENPTP